MIHITLGKLGCNSNFSFTGLDEVVGENFSYGIEGEKLKEIWQRQIIVVLFPPIAGDRPKKVHPKGVHFRNLGGILRRYVPPNWGVYFAIFGGYIGKINKYIPPK